MFLEDKWSAIEYEEDNAYYEVGYRCVITGFARVNGIVHSAASERADEHGECVDETIGVVHLVVYGVVHFFIFTLDHVQFNLHSFQHFGNDWDENEKLKDTNRWESHDDDPVVHGEV